MSDLPIGPTITQRLVARAERLEEEAKGLRRLARDLGLHDANYEECPFRFTEESKKALWRLAKL